MAARVEWPAESTADTRRAERKNVFSANRQYKCADWMWSIAGPKTTIENALVNWAFPVTPPGCERPLP
jgi:hypothetical protein